MKELSASGFEMLDHPADVGFRACGGNLPELFVNCARALTSTLIESESVSPIEQRTITVSADDVEYLLYNFLSELLFLFDAEQLLFRTFRVLELDETAADDRPDEGTALPGIAPGGPGSSGLWKLRLEADGERFDPERHQIETYVKAITLHQLSVRESKGRFEAAVYLDI